MRVHVGRQPICDGNGKVVAYELLFRSSATAQVARFDDPDAATAQVLMSTFLDLGLPDLVGEKLAFVNVGRNFLIGDLPLPVGPEQVVLEVLEDVAADEQVVAGVGRLVAAGYRIALDDVTATRRRGPLLALASYVKLDVQATALDALPALADDCRATGRELVAEKVETAAELAVCRELGIGLYQGYLFARPQTVTRESLGPGQLSCLRLVTLLGCPDTPLADVVRAVEQDAGLCYRLLRAVNSAATGLRRQIGSIEQAVLLVGRRALAGWVTLMMMAEEAGGEPLTDALVRARMCERLAALRGDADASAAFLVGLLSGLARPLQMSATELPDQLSLTPATADALRGGGRLGAVLAEAIAYEDACHPGEPLDGGPRLLAAKVIAAGDPDDAQLADRRGAYLDAVRWSQQLLAVSTP